MHIHNLHQWEHPHHFHVDDGHSERNTRRVILLTVFMMFAEIAAGMALGSMALLADGLHIARFVKAFEEEARALAGSFG